jgi:endonuclease YncB( thermonuclease family)
MWWMWIRAVLGAALVSMFAPMVALSAPVVEGALRVVDADTVEIDGQRIRLFGIDAPEHAQSCGLEAATQWQCGAWASSEVRARYEGRRARCRGEDRDRYGRMVARCFVDGQDMGRALVRDGVALAYRRYSRDYVAEEQLAAAHRRGVHAVGYQAPSDYRAERRSSGAAQGPDGCAIKGNLSRNSGRRIYHMPGQEHYARTRIDTARGERWFCSEAEARAAGWRRSKR